MFPLLVTAAVIEHQGRILLTRRRPDAPYPLLWEFPGGKLEPGEDPRDCVVRELREELDITIEAGAVLDVIYHRYPERTVLVMAYRCQWTAGEIKELEVAGHVWVPPDQILSFDLLPADIPLAERLAADCSHASHPGI